MKKSIKTWYRLILYLAIPFLYCMAWVTVVGPSPDKDGIYQLYYPLLNFLKGSEALGLDYFVLSNEFFNDAYPDGAAILAWLICFLKLDSFFLKEPYLIIIFLLIPFIPILLVTPLKSRNLLIICGLFFLPAVQICLKGFSPHAFNTLFSFAGVLSFVIYYRNKSIRWLIYTIFLFWVSMIFKHMGVLHFLSFLSAYFIWQLLGKTRSMQENILLMITPILAIPMYPWGQSSEYLQTSLSHAPYLRTDYLLIYFIFAILILIPIVILIIKSRSINSSKPKCLWLQSSAPVLIAICLMFWVWVEPPSENKSMHNALLVLALGYAVCTYLITTYRITGIRSLLILITLLTLSHNCSIYVSWIAKSSYLFFLPQLLLMFLWSMHRPRYGKLVLMVIGLILLSNLFPKLSLLEQNPQLNKLSSIYFEGFKLVHQNPLGWNKSKIRKMRNDLDRTFQAEGIQNGNLYINQALHYHSRNALLFARNIIHFNGSINALDDFNEEAALSLKKAWLNKKTKLFSEWSHSGKISLIITGKDPFTNRKNEIFNLSDLMTTQNFNPNQFLQTIGMHYFSHLKSTKTLQTFYRPVSVTSLQSLTFWIHREIKLKEKQLSAYDIWKSELTGLKNRFKNEAMHLFLESNQYYDSNPEKCLQLLKKANHLDPENTEVKKDLEALIQRLEK